MEEIKEIVIIQNNEDYLDESKQDETEYEKKFWKYDDTISLIGVIEARFDELNHPGKKKRAWENICRDLESMNINVTPKECSTKWQNLLRSYKSCIKNRNKSGRGPMRFNFFMRLDELLGDKSRTHNKHALNLININTINSSTPCQSLNIESSYAANISNSSEHDAEASNASSVSTCESLKRVRTDSNSSEEQNGEISPTVTPKGNRRKKNIQTDYINYKKEFYECKKAEWRKRRKDKKERETLKLELYKTKLKLEERKIRILEELVFQRNKTNSTLALKNKMKKKEEK